MGCFAPGAFDLQSYSHSHSCGLQHIGGWHRSCGCIWNKLKTKVNMILQFTKYFVSFELMKIQHFISSHNDIIPSEVLHVIRIPSEVLHVIRLSPCQLAHAWVLNHDQSYHHPTSMAFIIVTNFEWSSHQEVKPLCNHFAGELYLGRYVANSCSTVRNSHILKYYYRCLFWCGDIFHLTYVTAMAKCNRSHVPNDLIL